MKLSIVNLTNSPIETRDSGNARVVFPAAGIKAPPLVGEFDGDGLNLIRLWESLGSIKVEEMDGKKKAPAEKEPPAPVPDPAPAPKPKADKKVGKKKG